jgi:ketosteroid isomerase-like protein
MTASEGANIEVVRRYYNGCNSGDLDELLATFAPDVVHYFLPTSIPPVHGAEHLARYCRKFKKMVDPTWKIDRIIASGDAVVTEWSVLWTVPGTSRRIMSRGAEWYLMHEGRIAEVRAYFAADPERDSELATYPYASRGYLTNG